MFLAFIDVASAMIPPEVELARGGLARGGDPLGLGPRVRSAWAEGLDLPSRGELLFYAGDFYPVMGYAELLLRLTRSPLSTRRLASLGGALMRLGLLPAALRIAGRGANSRYQASLRKAVNTLIRLGVRPAILREEEPSFGAVLHTYGLLDEFSEHARGVWERLREAGVRTIVTPDPVAALFFRKHYPEFVDGWDVDAVTWVELVAERVASEGVRLGPVSRWAMRVTYHDPCVQSRIMGVVEQPRFLISEIPGVELVEPTRRGVNTGCSGDGGLELVQPEVARRLARARGEELKNTGAELALTTCPACLLTLRASGVEMFFGDLIDMVHDALLSAKRGAPREIAWAGARRPLRLTKPRGLSVEGLTSTLAELASRCVRCGFCNPTCSTAQVLDGLESRSARGRVTLIRAMVEGRDLRPGEVLDRLYTCVLCGACELACPAGLPVPDMIIYGRALAIKLGLVEREGLGVDGGDRR